jgi:hypothetical protein
MIRLLGEKSDPFFLCPPHRLGSAGIFSAEAAAVPSTSLRGHQNIGTTLYSPRKADPAALGIRTLLEVGHQKNSWRHAELSLNRSAISPRRVQHALPFSFEP